MLKRKGTRHRLPALILISMLGVAVFLWGLHYKLSLYHSSVARHAPAAKLLSQKERPSSGVQTACISPGARRVSGAGKRLGYGSHLAQLACAQICIEGYGTSLPTSLARPETPQDERIDQSSPRAPPVAA